MRLDEKVSTKSQAPQKNTKPANTNKNSNHKQGHNKPAKKRDTGNAVMGNAFADAFAKLKK